MIKVFLFTVLICQISASDVPELDAMGKVVESEQQSEEHLMQNIENHSDEEERQNIFNYMDEFMGEFFNHMNEMEDEEMGLDGSSGTGFIQEIEEHLGYITDDLCNNNKTDCEESRYLGCSCHAAFLNLEKVGCRGFACEVVSHFRNNGAEMMRGIKESGSLEELTQAAMRFATPISELVCRCNPELYMTVSKCALNYDGDEFDEDTLAEIRDFMSGIKFKEMEKFMGHMTRGYCGTDGECIGAFAELIPQVAAMMDRSCSERVESCDNMRRLSDGIWEFIDYMERDDVDHSVSNVIKVMTKYIAKNFWCGKRRCIKTWLADMFNNNCCYRNMTAQFTPKLVGSFGKFMKSIIGEDMPKFSRSVKKNIPKFINPNAACRGPYAREADPEQCEALKLL